MCDPVTGQCHCKVSPLMFPCSAFLLGSIVLLWQGLGVPSVPEGAGLGKESA